MGKVNFTSLAKWTTLFVVVVISCVLYVFLEWIFYVTKPSFMDGYTVWNKLLVLFQSAALLCAFFIFLLLVFWIIARLLPVLVENIYLKTVYIFPAFILSGLGLLLIDNFTYTIFRFGISSSQGVLRGIYGVLFLFITVVISRSLIHTFSNKSSNPKLGLPIMVVVFISALIMFIDLENDNIALNTGKTTANVRPNILLIGSDGVDADHMSVYGYERETTPNIEDFAREALIVNNNFTNSANTSGSVISILTSKLPTQTNVLYPPNLLQGTSAYQHLPGILKELGYYNVEFAAPHFADAYTLGILNGFDEANGKSKNYNIYNKLVGFGLNSGPAYFLSGLYDRITERIFHIFYFKEMKNPFDVKTQNPTVVSDVEKIESIIDLFEKKDGQPLFVHAHFMGTHGPKFNPEIKKFSIGVDQQQPYNLDYYDDSIYTFDYLFGELFNSLSKFNLLENTIIILYSDHGMGFKVDKRIPLIIRFPNGTHNNIIPSGQNIDIAPTVLDYLDVDKPEWMLGHSLIVEDRFEQQLIFSTGTTNTHNQSGVGWVLQESGNTPPFFQFDFSSLIYCQNWYRLNLETYEWTTGTVENYRDLCTNDELLTEQSAYYQIIQQLEGSGFEIPEALLNPTFIQPVGLIQENKETPSEQLVSPTIQQPDQTPALVNWEYPTAGWNSLIAHGLGEWSGIQSPNNYEAFIESYGEGFRVFEIDIAMSSDGVPLAAHDSMEEKYYGLSGKFSDYSAEEFLGVKLLSKGTTLAGPQILNILSEYPDIRIILDLKVLDQMEALGWFLDRLPTSQWPRVLSNVRSVDQAEELVNKYPDYHGAFFQIASWKDDLVFTDEEVTQIISQFGLAGVFTWIEELDKDLSYIENKQKHLRWTSNLEKNMIELDKAMVWHTSDNPELIETRRSAGGAIITNHATPAQTPERTVIITIDGLRPDAITPTVMPNLVEYINNSAYTLTAQTILPSATLPGHTSLLTGLCPSQHGVTWNDYKPALGYANAVDLFEIADAAGFRTAMIVGKIKLSQISEPENIDYFENITTGDEEIASRAMEIIDDGFDLLFVHFADNDYQGHTYGWLSNEQMMKLSETDKYFGLVIERIKSTDQGNGSLVILTADHGGHDKTHGSDQEVDMTIPWIISGRNIEPQQLEVPVSIVDTTPTLASLLDLPLQSEWAGHPIVDAIGKSSGDYQPTICK